MTITNPLTAAQKTRWLAALRSGEWRQGRARLERDGAYCCMGVLAKLLGRLDQHGRYLGLNAALLSANGRREVLPVETQNSLARMNDSGISFAHIADWIEANVEVNG